MLEDSETGERRQEKRRGRIATRMDESNISGWKAVTSFTTGLNISIEEISSQYFWPKEMVAKSTDVVDDRARRRMRYPSPSKKNDTTIQRSIQTGHELMGSSKSKGQT
jgi:hypothetical protein